MLSRALTPFVLMSAIAIASGASASAQQKPKAPAKPAADMLPTQVLLDRAGFSPGEIDGRDGRNTQTAINAFEKAAKTTIADALAAAEPVTITYTITDQDAGVPTVATIPEDMMEKAKLKRLDFTSVLEMIAERFHASPNLLQRLNPSARFTVGEEITVPNVNVVPEAEGTPVPNIVVRVSKGASALTVIDATGKVLMHAPVTSGSEHDPLPIGSWTVTTRCAQSDIQLQPRSLLGRRPEPCESEATTRTKRTGGIGVDRHQQTSLRHTRHA